MLLLFLLAFEAAKDAGGGDNTPYQRVKKFRLWLAGQEVQDVLADMDGQIREKLVFEAKKIQALLASVLKMRTFRRRTGFSQGRTCRTRPLRMRKQSRRGDRRRQIIS